GIVASDREGPRRYAVRGRVTFDGAPLKNGYLIVRPVSPHDRAEGAEIKGGSYELRAKPGAVKVEITADKETGEVGCKGEKITKNFIPAEYNTATTLQAEVSP